MGFEFERTNIADVIHVKPAKLGDERGYFAELFKKPEFEKFGIKTSFVQFNQSKSSKGVIRGLHYQLNPATQGKLVRVVSGEIFDVAVDLRKNSKFFGQWAGKRLNSDDLNMLYVPEGLAHGFSVLSDTAVIEYYCTEVYSKETERGIIYNDPFLNIDWQVEKQVLSPKDLLLPTFEKAEKNF